jgi:hypothetical protein
MQQQENLSAAICLKQWAVKEEREREKEREK